MAFARPALRATASRALASAAAGPSRAPAVHTARRAASFYSPQLAGLTDEQAELRQAVADFAAAEVDPIAARVDRDNEFPQELWTKLGDQGLLGLTVPEEYGGLGKSYFDHLLVMEGPWTSFATALNGAELSRASGSIALSYGAHSNVRSRLASPG